MACFGSEGSWLSLGAVPSSPEPAPLPFGWETEDWTQGCVFQQVSEGRACPRPLCSPNPTPLHQHLSHTTQSLYCTGGVHRPGRCTHAQPVCGLPGMGSHKREVTCESSQGLGAKAPHSTTFVRRSIVPT